ncbi:MAG: SDR family oxidoreductase [Actinobacteria bacterium]|nr:SDR family oxidoreductase [Actinomycetota bacterium]
MVTSRRVALIAGAGFYVGPPLARLLAERGHDLVLGDPDRALVDELEARGTQVEAVNGTRDLSDPTSAQRLVDAGVARFGRIDSATAFSGQIVTGRFMKSTVDDFRTVLDGCMVAPYHFLKAVLPPMIEAGDGQVLVITSASAARATPGAPLYSAARAGATHLVRNVADEVARNRVQVNAVGTNFMDFPEFRRASGADDPEVRARLEAMVPLGRLGTMDEFAHFCAPFVDGTSRFTTGQFVAYAGGWA